MSIYARTSLSPNIKDSNITLLDGVSVLSNDENIGFQTYYHEQLEKEQTSDCPENELRFRNRWNNFRISRRKSYIRDKCKSSLQHKRTLSQRSSSPNSISISSNSTNKKMKVESKENCPEVDSNLIGSDDNFYKLEVQRLIASPAYYSFQPVCNVCENYTDISTVIRCTGVCLRYFHQKCLVYQTENPLPSDIDFQCVDCWNNTYKCAICSVVDKITSLIHCEIADCGRLYHKNCLETAYLPYKDITKESVKSCPAHHCSTCAREDACSVTMPSTKLFQCIRCPMAFHDADLCTAAGSVELSLSNVICPRHFENKLIKMSFYKPIHPDFCFKCFKIQPKIQCLYCPSSFHHNCTGVTKKKAVKGDTFICKECRFHREPRYGEIVFVKVSSFRWWPCEIIHPRNAPINVLKLKRPDGAFPILFLGSHEYQWASRTRTVYYDVAMKSSIAHDSRGSTKTDKDFTKGMAQAATMNQIFVNMVLRHVPLKSITADPMTKSELDTFFEFKDKAPKSIKYRLIKDNVVVPPAKLPEPSPQVVCDCVDSCLPLQCNNYQSRIQCSSTLCATKDRCYNQLFTGHINKHLAVTKTNNCGFGLRTTRSLDKDEFVIEYVGEIISDSVSVLRMNTAKKNYVKDFFMLRIGDDLIIDAGPRGNLSRFMNHCCDNNCRVERWLVDGQVRLGIFTNTDISDGDELTLDYRVSGFVMHEDMFCLCNGASCSGFLGPDKIKNVSPMKVPVSKAVVEEAVVKIEDTSEDMDGGALMAMERLTVDPPGTSVAVIGLPQNPTVVQLVAINQTEPTQVSESDAEHPLSTRTSLRRSKIDPVKEFLSKLVPIKANVIKPKPITESTNIFLNSDPVPEPNQKPLNKKVPIKPYSVTESLNYVPDKLKIMKALRKKIRTKKPTKKEDAFDEYIKTIDHLKESQKKPILRQPSQRKAAQRRDYVPFDEYVKTIETLNKSNSAVSSKRKRTVKKESLVADTDPGASVSHLCASPIVDIANNESEPQEKTSVTCTMDEVVKEESNQETEDAVDTAVEEVTMGEEESIVDNVTQKSPTEVDKDGSDVDEVAVQEGGNLNEDKVMEVIKDSYSDSDIIGSIADEIASPGDGNLDDVIIPKESYPDEDSDHKSDTATITEAMSSGDVHNDQNEVEDISKDRCNRSMDSETMKLQSPDQSFNTFADTSTKKDVVYESFCFRCFDGGELVLCDKPGCTKTYHLSCIGLKSAPLGTWYCPWHFCDSCGLPSTIFCVQCPASFCGSHCTEDNILASTPPSSHLSLCLCHRQWRGECVPTSTVVNVEERMGVEN